MLLHGMGGVGKTTLASVLAEHMEQSGVFAGGVYRVSVTADVQYAVDKGKLLGAQHRLLELVTHETERRPYSLDEGAQALAQALTKQKAKVPVLLVIDNVPEGSSGILGLLPPKQDLKESLADG
jgi:Holliday junction resolvasome RuvABC ATP-dependent DNA helicase subunit